jgi:hypothetical protein
MQKNQDFLISEQTVIFAARHPELSRKPALSEAEGDPYSLQYAAAQQGVLCPTGAAAYASTKNFPSRIICSSSTQMLNFRPTTSIWVDESHSAPVCTP